MEFGAHFPAVDDPMLSDWWADEFEQIEVPIAKHQLYQFVETTKIIIESIIEKRNNQIKTEAMATWRNFSNIKIRMLYKQEYKWSFCVLEHKAASHS